MGFIKKCTISSKNTNNLLSFISFHSNFFTATVCALSLIVYVDQAWLQILANCQYTHHCASDWKLISKIQKLHFELKYTQVRYDAKKGIKF